MVKFKLDENISSLLKQLLSTAGFDTETVDEELLSGAPDRKIAERCRQEGRCLITADRDFTQILDFPPEQYGGFVVLQHPQLNLTGLKTLILQLITALKTESPVGKLWIVEPGRVRIHGERQK